MRRDISLCNDVISLCYLNCTHIILATCSSGQQPNDAKTGCMECPVDQYKTEDEATADWRSSCTACASGTGTILEGSTECFGKS